MGVPLFAIRYSPLAIRQRMHSDQHARYIPPRSVDLRPPTLQTIPEAIGRTSRSLGRGLAARSWPWSRPTGTATAPSRSPGPPSPPEPSGSARRDIAEASALRAAGLTVPILTWLHPSGVDAEAAAAGRIDVAVGSVDELDALLGQRRLRPCGSICTWTPAWPGTAARCHEWDALIARARGGNRRGQVRVVGSHGAPAAGRPGRSRGERAGGVAHARGAAGGPERRGSVPRSPTWRQPRGP